MDRQATEPHLTSQSDDAYKDHGIAEIHIALRKGNRYSEQKYRNMMMHMIIAVITSFDVFEAVSFVCMLSLLFKGFGLLYTILNDVCI